MLLFTLNIYLTLITEYIISCLVSNGFFFDSKKKKLHNYEWEVICTVTDEGNCHISDSLETTFFWNGWTTALEQLFKGYLAS